MNACHDAAFVVDGAAAVDESVDDLARKRRVRPLVRRRRHHVQVRRQQVRQLASRWAAHFVQETEFIH